MASSRFLVVIGVLDWYWLYFVASVCFILELCVGLGELEDKNSEWSLNDGNWIKDSDVEVELLLDWWWEDDKENVLDYRRAYLLFIRLELYYFVDV